MSRDRFEFQKYLDCVKGAFSGATANETEVAAAFLMGAPVPRGRGHDDYRGVPGGGVGQVGGGKSASDHGRAQGDAYKGWVGGLGCQSKLKCPLLNFETCFWMSPPEGFCIPDFVTSI